MKLDDVSHEVSRASHHVGFALVPANDATVLRSVDFVALDERRVLVVPVASGQQVWHKTVTLEEAVAPTDLAQAANYLNGEFAGHRLADIRAALVSRMRADRALYDRLAACALQLASATLGDVAPEAQLVVHGASSLVEDASGDAGIPLPTLRTVLGMIEEKDRLVRLVEERVYGIPGIESIYVRTGAVNRGGAPDQIGSVRLNFAERPSKTQLIIPEMEIWARE